MEHLVSPIQQPEGKALFVGSAITAGSGAISNKSDPEKMADWTPPPMPPIPTELEEEAWRKRSNKRQSYTSHMTCGSTLQESSASIADTDKHWRPISEISATSTSATPLARDGRTSRRKPSKPEDDVYSDLHWDINSQNPRNWGRRKKWAHTFVAAAVTFTITLASSIVAPATRYLATDKATSSTVAMLPLSLFLLGLASGPLLSGTCSAMFGRKIIYIIFVMLFAIFTLAAGLINSMSGILVCRLIAGILAGPALSQGGAILAEMWTLEQRTRAVLFYATMPLVGSIVGLVVGSYVRWNSNKYDWTRYVVLFAPAACLVPIVFISETSRNIILRRQQRHTTNPLLDGDGVGAAVFAPLRSLIARPPALLLSLQSSYAFATLYAAFVAFPGVFADAYSFDMMSQGLVFLSMLIGVVLGFLVLHLDHEHLHAPRVEQWQTQRAAAAEKARRTSSRHRSAASNFSRPTVRHDRNRESAIQTPAPQATMSRPQSKGCILDSERNNGLALAAAEHLNSLEANKDKTINPKHIAAMLNGNPTFEDLCAALKSIDLRFDNVQLAKALVDALPVPSTSDGPVKPQQSALVSSTSLHRSAAMARMAEPAAVPLVPRLPSRHAAASERNHVRDGPPAEWHLWPALPASILGAGSLFLFAWTAKDGIHWAVPCVGMGLFAFSAYVTIVSTQSYISDRYESQDGEDALAGSMVLRYLLSFGFTLFVVPMYDRLGAAWATSVFGFMGLAVGIVPWVLVFVARTKSRAYWV